MNRASDLWPALVAANQTAGGQQQEHVQYNAHTQVLVQVLQALGLVLAVGLIGAGVWLLAGGVTWLVARLEVPADWALAALALASVGIVVRRLTRALTGRWEARIWPVVAELLSTTGLVLLGLRVVAGGEWSFLRVMQAVAGVGCLLAGPLLLWRFSNELFNPWFPKSPVVIMMENLIDRLTQGPEEPERIAPFPVRVNGKVHGATTAEAEEPEAEEAEEPAAARIVDPEFVDLVEFVELAAVRGLARDALVVEPRLRLRSGQRLTRGYFERLMSLAAETWGFVRPGGGGTSAEWAVEPGRAIAILRAALELATGQATGQAG